MILNIKKSIALDLDADYISIENQLIRFEETDKNY